MKFSQFFQTQYFHANLLTYYASLPLYSYIQRLVPELYFLHFYENLVLKSPKNL